MPVENSAAPLQTADDVSPDYAEHRRQAEIDANTAEFNQWLDSRQAAPSPNLAGDIPPEPFPTNKVPPQTGVGPVSGTVRAVSEMPRQVIGGAQDFLVNSTSPLVSWLNENVADLRTPSMEVSQPKTGLGAVTRSASRFLVGFIPALKGMQALGAGAVAAPMAAGAISDFLGTGEHEKRLADMWTQANLPKNVLTDFLSSSPDDTLIEDKFKAAVEGALAGSVLQSGASVASGVISAGLALRAARAAKKSLLGEQAAQTATQAAKAQYGEITAEQSKQVLGDPSAPLISGPSKLDEAMAKTVKVGPEEVIPEHPVSSGFTRLYRIDAVSKVDHPEWIQQDLKSSGALEARGRWFVSKKELLKFYSDDYADKGHMVYVDIATDQLEKFRVSNVKDEIAGRTPKSFSRDPENEFFLPADLAATKQPVKVAVQRKPGQEGIYVNFARIDKPEDVNSVIDDLAQRFSGSINEAKRGTITQKETEKLADDMGMTFDDLMSRKVGQPFNAETAVAARRLWSASGENLLAAAKKASDPNAGAVDQFAFRRALAAHYAIQSEVIGARAETARALASWRIPAGSGIEQSQAVQELVMRSGGSEVNGNMARMLVDVAERNPRAVGKFAAGAQKATTLDAVLELWVNGLLTGITTSGANISSNLIFATQQIAERGTARFIGEARSALTGGQTYVAPGEATALAYGEVSAIKDAFRFAWRSWKTGETGFGTGKVDLPRTHSMSSEGLQIATDSAMGRTVDVLGSAFRIPGSSFMTGQDEFFKTIAYRGEVAAQALRQGVAEGLTGVPLAQRVQYLKANPTDEIKLQAMGYAQYSTFTQQTGDLGQIFLAARGKFPATALIFPFVKTPVNLMRSGLERTPFAPMVGQWRADIAAGGARRDIALARISMGSSILLTAMDYADSGMIFGSLPKNAAERDAMTRQGALPDSIKVGDRFYQFSRLDPIGMMLGFAADTSEALRRGEVSQDDVDQWNEVAAMAISVVAKNSLNKSYMQGMANFVEVMEDPDRYSQQYISGMVASFVPMTSMSMTLRKAEDPLQRDVNSPWDAIKNRIMFLSEDLPPRLNLWGESATYSSGLGKGYDIFSPVQSKEVKPSPIDTEIMRLAPIAGADNVPGSAPNKIAKKSVFGGVQVNFKEWPKEYEHYVRLAGNDYKDPFFGKGAKDFLNDMVQGKNVMSVTYRMKDDTMKMQLINVLINRYRAGAQRAMLDDPKYAGFAEYVRYLQHDKLQRRMPVIEGQQIQAPEMTQ